MKFIVQRLYDKGVRLPDQSILNGVRIEGELRTREERDVNGEITRVASLLDGARPHEKLLPDLHHADLVNISPLAMTLRGFERVMTATGPTEVRQEWWIRQPAGDAAATAVLPAAAVCATAEYPAPGHMGAQPAKPAKLLRLVP
ncbi:MAG TPA: hypothetical protein VN667_21720 [Burkholderiales bacterium]|jgi:hypothetical protein|nr:hypothetical protein [Burkholderiales bacterium]